MSEAKPFVISKRLVWEAYRRVKSNRGAAGVDRQSIKDFDRDRDRNLYRIWNRMSSGSYFPPPVKAVPIAKKSGGVRMLGVPTVSDRIAQTTVTLALEPVLEPVFHEDSYGYRRGKSAHDALAVTRKRCWRYDWVLEYDIRGLFDNIDHTLMLKALLHHCSEPWIVHHVKRWLTAPMQESDGTLTQRRVGTPQGGPLSPVLSNLFLHYALDNWLATHHSGVPFCRYADDGVLHCRSQAEATRLHEQLDARLADCGLQLHPEKTRIVYCSGRRGAHENVKFDFLGYTFQPRAAKNRSGRLFVSFLPAMSRAAMKSIRQTIRGWRLHRKSESSLESLAKLMAPSVRGWMNYYCRFYGSMFQVIARHLDRVLIRWAMRKYKRLRAKRRRACAWLEDIRQRHPGLFVHWSGRGAFAVGTTGAR